MMGRGRKTPSLSFLVWKDGKGNVPTLRKLLCSRDGAGDRHIIFGVEKALMGGAHQSLYQ